MGIPGRQAHWLQSVGGKQEEEGPRARGGAVKSVGAGAQAPAPVQALGLWMTYVAPEVSVFASKIGMITVPPVWVGVRIK